MKLFVVLLILPVVLAGDFAKMWAEVEKELQTKEFGGNQGKGPKTEEPKDVGEKPKGPKEGPKEVEEEPHKWGDKPKGWGEEPKGWGDEHKGWGEKPKDGKDGKDGKDDKSNNTKSLYDGFKSWLAEQENHKKEEEEEKDFMKRNLEKFKEYMKMMQYKQMQEQQAKETLKKEMEKVQLKKMLADKLYNASKEYAVQKIKFTQSIATHFLEFCQCDTSNAVFERITKGQFGDAESLEMEWDFNMDNSMDDRDNEGNMTIFNGTFSGNNTSRNDDNDEDDDDEEKKKLKDTVKWFAKVSKQEQVKYVLNDLVKVMCSSASHYLGKMKEVEVALIEYKKRNGN